MNTEEKLLILLKKLHENTVAGKLDWTITTQKDVFQAAFPSHTVRLSSEGSEYEPDDVIHILDEAGNIIERTSDPELTMLFKDARPFDLMKNLYSLARRRALGVDSALDSLLGEL